MAKKKDKPRYSGIRKGVRILGVFHYVSGVFQIIITILSIFAGISFMASSFKAQLPSVLSFMASWDNTLVGILLVFYLLIRIFTEFLVGRNWRRKATDTKQQTLTLILLGIKLLRVLSSILNGDFLSSRSANILSLILYSISFALAFLIHREYLRTKRNLPKEP